MTKRIRQHVLSQLLCLGRHTITGVLSTSGQLFTDWTADYRMYSHERVDPGKLFAPVRQRLTQQLASDAPLVAALDDTRLRKTGSKTHGVKYTRDPLGPAFHVNFIKAQRFVQLSMASPAGGGMARMVPIDFVHAPAAVKPRRDADPQALAQYRQAQRETALPKVGADRLRKLRDDMDEDGQYERPLWTTVDGGYTNRTFIKRLPERTRAVGRIRADAKLYHLPEPTQAGTGGVIVSMDSAHPRPKLSARTHRCHGRRLKPLPQADATRSKSKPLLRSGGGRQDRIMICVLWLLRPWGTD